MLDQLDFIDENFSKRGPDLISRSWVARLYVVLTDHSLNILEYRVTSDRIRRIKLERIKQLTWSRRKAWGHMLASALVAACLSIIIFAVANTTTNPAALALAITPTLIALIFLVYYAYCGSTTIHFWYDGNKRSLNFIAPPKRIQRFIDRTTERVATEQENTWIKHEQELKQPSATSSPEQTDVGTPIEINDA